MKTIINCTTGEITERELNDEELAQQVIDEANQAALEKELQVKAEIKNALLEKLGITEEEAKLLLS